MLKQKMLINDGFAIWLDGNNKQFDVHINEWMMPLFGNFIEFGIRVYEANHVNKIGLFIPFYITESEIVDLSSSLENEPVARGIFNAYCKITSYSNCPISEIEYKGRKENIIKLSFLKKHIEKCCQGTIIYFDISYVHTILTQNEIYIRFRVPHKSLDVLFFNKKQNLKSLFESPVIKYQFNYIMKINDIRSLPQEVRCIPELSSQDIKKIVVLISCKEDYDIDDKECYKIRLLEKDLFSSHVPPNFDCNNVITYQWREQSKKNYVFKFVINNESISKKSLFEYAIIVIVLSAIGSALWQCVSKLIYYILNLL